MSTLLATRQEAATQTAAKILSFRALPVGWHYGDGAAPAEKTVDAALRLNEEAMSLGFD